MEKKQLKELKIKGFKYKFYILIVVKFSNCCILYLNFLEYNKNNIIYNYKK